MISTTMTCTILDKPPSSSSHHHLAERIIHYPIAARFGSTSNKQYSGGGSCNTVPDMSSYRHESITTKSHSCCIAHLDNTESCIQTRTLTEKRDNTSSKNSLMSKCSVLLLSHLVLIMSYTSWLGLRASDSSWSRHIDRASGPLGTGDG